VGTPIISFFDPPTEKFVFAVQQILFSLFQAAMSYALYTGEISAKPPYMCIFESFLSIKIWPNHETLFSNKEK
jgi:hypothetical protein